MEQPDLNGFIHLIKKTLKFREDDVVTGKSKFADLGLDSIQIMYLMQDIDAAYGVVLPINDFFEAECVEDLYNRLLKQLH